MPAALVHHACHLELADALVGGELPSRRIYNILRIHVSTA